MRALVIDENVREQIQQVKDYAEANPFSMDDLLDTKNGELAAAGDLDGKHVLEIPVGYRVVFSMEQQPAGLCRHMSVSVDFPGKLPSVPSVIMLMKEFGFDHPLDDDFPHHGKVWMEEGGYGTAINVLEIIK